MQNQNVTAVLGIQGCNMPFTNCGKAFPRFGLLEIKRLFHEGWSDKEIAAVMDSTAAYIKRIRNEHGWTRAKVTGNVNNAPWSPHELELLLYMWGMGKSIEFISRKFNRPASVIRKELKNQGFTNKNYSIIDFQCLTIAPLIAENGLTPRLFRKIYYTQRDLRLQLKDPIDMINYLSKNLGITTSAIHFVLQYLPKHKKLLFICDAKETTLIEMRLKSGMSPEEVAEKHAITLQLAEAFNYLITINNSLEKVDAFIPDNSEVMEINSEDRFLRICVRDEVKIFLETMGETEIAEEVWKYVKEHWNNIVKWRYGREWTVKEWAEDVMLWYRARKYRRDNG